MPPALGYFIFPLEVVGIGWIGVGACLSLLQNSVIALATLVVVIITVSQRILPWIALIISVSFGLYGYVKKKISTGPVASVTAESFIVCPVCSSGALCHASQCRNGCRNWWRYWRCFWTILV